MNNQKTEKPRKEFMSDMLNIAGVVYRIDYGCPDFWTKEWEDKRELLWDIRAQEICNYFFWNYKELMDSLKNE